MEANTSRRKSLQLNIAIERLRPDPFNPRLPKNLRGKSERKLLNGLRRIFDLEELAYSMAENGYFDEEPLIVFPEELRDEFMSRDLGTLRNDETFQDFLQKESTILVVAEGNRRLSTAKILLSGELQTEMKIRNWPEISSEVKNDLRFLPTIVYPTRKELLPYLGVRHIAGIKKWDAFSKVLYIADMIEEGYEIDELQQKVGDRSNSVRKVYFCYKLIEEMENEFDWDTQKARDLFSYLVLAVGQGAVKEFLGMPKKWKDVEFEQPLPKGKTENLKSLFSWLFGEGKEILPVVKESRDITNFLAPILQSQDSTDHLRITRDLRDSFDRSGGELSLLLKNMKRANRNLESSLGIIFRHKTEEVRLEAKKCSETLDSIFKLLED